MFYDVLFHVDTDSAALDMALTNIANYFGALKGETYTVVLLINGPAIRLMVKDDAHADRLEALAGKGLDIRVCQNAMMPPEGVSSLMSFLRTRILSTSTGWPVASTRYLQPSTTGSTCKPAISTGEELMTIPVTRVFPSTRRNITSSTVRQLKTFTPARQAAAASAVVAVTASAVK